MPATNELLQEGRYRISQSSGQNGTEKVFEAYDTVRNTNVVVREIQVKFNKVATVSQRESINLAFANQAKALTEIEHESLLPVQDYFSEIDRQYLVMDAVEGDDLRTLLSTHKRPFSVSQVTTWADELLDALNYLHTRKPAIIHRNINPRNVKLNPSGKIKLIGVGVESSGESEFASNSADSDSLRYSPMEHIWPGLDPASQKVITNSYDERSERILKQPLDERSDIYSLGATLYFLMTGVEPVDPIERSIEILEGKLDPLREPTKVNSSIPAEISDVLMKSLEIKRENRYDSAMIMRQVLKTAISRCEERLQEENREQEEAAAIIRQATQQKNERSAAEVEEEKRLAAEAQQKRLAAEAEEKRLAAEAEEKRLAAEAEQKRLAAEAEQKRLEEEKRLAAEAEQKRLAEEAEAKRQEAEAEQRRQQELMQKQLREAEQQRLEAERTAEADRLMREAEESESADAAPAVPEDNLLDIPVSGEVVAYRDTAASVEEDELAAVLKELEEADAAAASESHAKSRPAESDDVLVFDNPIDMEPQPSTDVATHALDDSDDDIISVPQKSGSSLPMPAIVGAVGLVVVLAIGGWFFMSGSKETPKPAAVQVAQPAPVEPNPTPEAVVTSASTDSNTAAVEPAADQSTAAAATKTASAKPKKAETAKAAEKKKVTVDDLINDN